VIAHFTHTEPGGHPDNQDCLELRPLAAGPECYLCAVADGQGGRSGAALAAATACKACLNSASAFSLKQLLCPAAWPDLLRAADEAVAKTEGAGYTTSIAFCVTESAVCGGSNGDSAALVLNPRQAPSILTQYQEKNPPLGSGVAEFVPFASRLVGPWTVLAMTDGVWKYAGWESVLAAAAEASGEAIIHRLRAKASLHRSGGLQDDFTLAILQGGLPS
jgi:hypothetical protein